MSKKLVEDAIIRLLHSGKGSYGGEGKLYYGYLLNNMRRIYTNKVPTAGVNVTDQVNLYINLDFFKTLTDKQRVQVLEHEAMHVTNFHMKRMKACSAEDAYLWNLACDAAINEPLDSLHEMGVTYDKLKEQIKDLEPNQPAEYYFKMMKDFRDKNGGKGGKGDQKLKEAGDTIDSHDQWDKNEDGEPNEGLGQQNEEIAKQIVQKTMKKAVEQAGGRGYVPNHILLQLERLGQSSVNWKQQLRRFFARTDQFVRENTRMKRNRRYGFLFPGKKKKPVSHIAVALDESGSVGNDEFTQFFSELDDIVESGTRVTVIHADTDVNKVYEYEAKMKIERTGCGGTYYMPAIKKAQELNVDGMIYFGDGDIWGEELEKPRFPFLWALVRNSDAPAEWGGVCRVTVNESKS